jgi:hypothetical protein
VDVTPELASSWLSRNVHNRNIRAVTVESYANDKTAGDRMWSGETIKFAVDGSLIDGQHRLHAIVRAEVTVPMLVVRGLDAEAQEDIDSGLPRKFHDVLRLRGEVNASILAAILRRVWLWEHGYRRSYSKVRPTPAQLLRTLEATPQLREIAGRANFVAANSSLPASTVGLLIWLFSALDYEDCEAFFDRLVDGQNLSKGDPVYELRRTIQGAKDARGQRNQIYLLVITIKAWNAYRQGETVGLYRWRAGGAKPEAFPEPI